MIPSFWMVLAGCTSDEKVVAEMERALVASNVALAAGLVAAEIVSHTHEVPDSVLRHPDGSEFGCPGVTDWQGTTDNFFVTLDYAEIGCIPDSGLVPTVIGGHAGLQWTTDEVTVTWDELFVDTGNAVSGSLGGPVEVVGQDLNLGVQGDLTVGTATVAFDLDLQISSEGVTVDGDATVMDDVPDPLQLEALVLGPDDIVAPCATPHAGTARLDGDGAEVAIDFANPGDGLVTVERKNKVSESVPLCDYRSDLF